jgi:hypothetical protein
MAVEAVERIAESVERMVERSARNRSGSRYDLKVDEKPELPLREIAAV